VGARSWAEPGTGSQRPTPITDRSESFAESAGITVPVTSPSGQTGVIAGRSLMGGIAARVAVLTSADASAVAVV
jgi:hypothetical protein